MLLAITVPIAAPCVPNAGIGPAPRISTTLSVMLSTVIPMPRYRPVRASPAARSAPPSMKNISIPMLKRNIVRRNGSASAFTSGVALIISSSHGAEKYPSGAMMKTESAKRGEKGLVDGLVDVVVIVGAGEPRHQHAHAGEERADEDDHDEKDLPAHADRRVAGEADVVPHHRVVDDPLQAADGVLQHRRPRDLPDRRADRSFDDRPIELAALLGRTVGSRASDQRGIHSRRALRLPLGEDVASADTEGRIIASPRRPPGYGRWDERSVRRTSPCASTTAGWRCSAS